MLKKRYLLFLIFIMSVFSLAAAENYTPVGRYIVEQDGAQKFQIDPLQETFKLSFPITIDTIEKAMSYLLNNTGYSLAPKQYQSSEAVDLLKQRLPISDRQFGPMTVQDGLLALAGSSYQMLVDPQRRYISFQLYQRYEKLYQFNNWSKQ